MIFDSISLIPHCQETRYDAESGGQSVQGVAEILKVKRKEHSIRRIETEARLSHDRGLDHTQGGEKLRRVRVEVG